MRPRGDDEGAEMSDFPETEAGRRVKRGSLRSSLLAGIAVLAMLMPMAAQAETIGGALAKAYLSNPDINQQRAAVRVSDENVPRANAGFLPSVTASANAGLQRTYLEDAPQTGGTNSRPRGYQVSVTQPIYNGDRNGNSVRQAESGVLGAREQLRNTEQNVLLSALTYYMDVLRDAAILDLQRSNVDVLQEQLRQTKDRFNVGEVTRTDVAQAEAARAGAQAQALSAQSNLQSAMAHYRQAVGDEPKSLSPVSPVTRPLPRSLQEAVAISQTEHPAIVASLHGVDAAELAIKINEGALYPTVGLSGSVTKSFDPAQAAPGARALTGYVGAQISLPVYDGGLSYANIRQAKEQLGQQELSTDLQRDKVRAAVVAAWGLNQNSQGIVRAAKAQVEAAEVALAGVREEAKVGQRTTLDVLNAQQTLLSARVQLVTAQHDQVVNSYNLLSAVGRLSVKTLGVAVAKYDPRTHFDQVKSKWFGVRTPDGK